MLIALAGEQPFVTPRTKFELDIDAILTRVQGAPTTKGMIFNRVLSLARDHDEDELLAAAGFEERRFIPFESYPWHDYLRLCCAVSDTLYSSRSAGLRHIGRTLYVAFADSVAGRVTFGLLRNNADRVISLGTKAWNMIGAPGEVLAESIDDCHYRYHFTDYPAEIAETLGIGVIEGALAECGEVPRLRYARADPMNAVIDIRWGDAPEPSSNLAGRDRPG